MGSRESWGSGKMWNEELDQKKNPRQAGQGKQIWKAGEVGRGVGDHGKREEGCMEQDWKSQGRRQGQEEGGEKRMQGQAGAHRGSPGLLGRGMTQDEHTGKGVFLYSELSATNMAQGPHRDHGGRAETLNTP